MRNYKVGDTIKFTLKPYEQLIKEGRADTAYTYNGIPKEFYGDNFEDTAQVHYDGGLYVRIYAWRYELDYLNIVPPISKKLANKLYKHFKIKVDVY